MADATIAPGRGSGGGLDGLLSAVAWPGLATSVAARTVGPMRRRTPTSSPSSPRWRSPAGATRSACTTGSRTTETTRARQAAPSFPVAIAGCAVVATRRVVHFLVPSAIAPIVYILLARGEVLP